MRNIKAIKLLNDNGVWWGSPEEVAELGGGLIRVGETPSQIAKSIGIYDIETVKRPLGFFYDGRFIESGEYQLVHSGVPWSGSGIEIIPRRAQQYVALQNKTLFTMLDKLSDFLQVESVGMLGVNGEITMAQFRLDSYDVAGDPNEQTNAWLLFADNKVEEGFNVGEVNRRVVCENTYRLAVRKIEPLPHTDDLEVYLRYIVEAYYIALEQVHENRQLLNWAYRRKLSSDEIATGIQRVLPEIKPSRNLRVLSQLTGFDLPQMALTKQTTQISDNSEIQGLIDKEVGRYLGDLNRVAERRVAVKNALDDFNTNHPKCANTAYALFNSVTYVTSHGDTIYKQDGRLPLFYGNDGYAQLWGDRSRLNLTAWDYIKGLN